MNVHDFPDDALARAVPYGIYDLEANRGYVYVGTSAETGEFAVEAIVLWWREVGREMYPHAKRLLILADGGGANGSRLYLWKERLQCRLVDEQGVVVTVCHYPPGCSKWNPVEHRLFGPISINWAGIPLRSLDSMIALIRGTTTNSGLHVDAALLDGVFETGRKVSKQLMKWLNLVRAEICPQWNYTLSPRPLSDPPRDKGIRKLMPWDLAQLVS